ncbi:glutamine amidotransferase-like class 1 domain-containing protein 3, mitochondrial [Saccoglossus kowalevskii]|uniref:ES1 protein homolog, mitochondrial-like n=1 Tax=Saccoglossus kowalevskii TaxID=10224 RepID=A0ABM0GY01_SACKO|nr:PREDICTED: ES1 protein homolog, mitochondrial-like [Saccoglossus kowalevskii]
MLASHFVSRSTLARRLLGSSYIAVRSCHHGKKGSKVAVVLSGSGVYDGSEIHEASAVLVHLSRGSAKVSMYAPDIPQMHVINHCKGEPVDGETRNVLTESARIARGNIEELSKLKANDFDAVIFPGGFGAAKNLCNFAVEGTKLSVNPDVERVLKEFHSAKKPIGLCCIAPVLAAKVIKGCELTVGHDQEEDGKWPYAGTAGALQELGAKHVNTSVTDIHVDDKNNVITTAAYMCATELHNIFDGIGQMVSSVLHRVK